MSNGELVGLTSDLPAFGVIGLRESYSLTAPASAKRKFSHPLGALFSSSVAAKVVHRLVFDPVVLRARPRRKVCLRAASALTKSTRIAHWVASRFEVARWGCCASTQWPHFSTNTGGSP
jgi:hypothetical protein